MATSNSEDGSVAPKDFQQLTSSSDSGSRLSPDKRKCPLCCKFKKSFHCLDCIHNGLFCSSDVTKNDRYFEKKQSLLELQENVRQLERNCSTQLETKRKASVLRTEIIHAKDRNKILKLAIEDKRRKKSSSIIKLNDLKEKNVKIQKNLPQYCQKVQQLDTYVANRREKVEEIEKILRKKQTESKYLVKLRLQQLFKFIFPISEIAAPPPQPVTPPPPPPLPTEVGSDEAPAPAENVDNKTLEEEIAEAAQTTYVRNRWEYTDYNSEMKYSIVAPTLPGSGNYSAYNIWRQQNRDVMSGSNNSISVETSPAYSISAALSYTAQCLHVLSFYMNIRLPHKIVYNEFCNANMSETQFARKVARLNANILYLCFTQKVDLQLLRSCETIHNILQLLNDKNADLGRQGPIELDADMADALEGPLADDLDINEDSDSEEGDTLPVEWETVPNVQCPEAVAGALNVQSMQMITTQQASSVAGGLMNSAAASLASFFKGFTGR